MNIKTYLRDQGNWINCNVSYRGGSLKVDIGDLLSQAGNEAIINNGQQAIIGAYQNYLGGGIAGRIMFGSMFDGGILKGKDAKTLETIKEEIKRVFYEINNGGGDEYMQENVTGGGDKGYKINQGLPTSGY